jgi:hypothetical protein
MLNLGSKQYNLGKLKMFKTKLIIATLATLGFASSANAGVYATSYYGLTNLKVEVDGAVGAVDGVADSVNVSDFISVTGGQRLTNTSATFNNDSDGNAVTAGPEGEANASLSCAGPDCAVLGLTEDGQSLDAGTLIASDDFNFAASDVNVTGSAVDGDAIGYTYAEASIHSGNNTNAAASSNIINNLTTTISFSVAQAVNLRLSAVVDLFINAFISDDIASDNSIAATASAFGNFNFFLLPDFSNGNGGAGVAAGASNFSQTAQDNLTSNKPLAIVANDQLFASDWFSIGDGDYTLTINQTSNAQVSLVSAPSMLAFMGLALFAAGSLSRKRRA